MILSTILLGFMALSTVFTMLYYEKALSQTKESLSDYKRAYNLAKNSQNYSHYTQLQLDNKNLQEQIRWMDADNKAMSMLLNRLKKEMAGDKGIQYESSTYKSTLWESNLYANQQELEQEPFVRKYGPKFD